MFMKSIEIIKSKYKDILYLFNANIITKIVVFSGQLFVAAMITPNELGQIKSALTYVEIIAVIGCFGLNTAILFKCDIKTDDNDLRRIVQSSLYTATFFCLILVIIVSVFSTLSGFDFASDEVRRLLIYLAWSAPLIVGIQICTSFLQSLQKYKDIFIVTVYPKSISLILLVIFTYNYGVDGYVIAYILGALFSLAYILMKEMAFFRPMSFSRVIVASQISVGKNAMLSNLIGIIGINLGFLVLNASGTSQYDIGQYAFAFLVYSGCEVITQTAQQFFLPKYSSFKNDLDKWSNVVVSSERNFLLASIVIGLVVSFGSLSVYLLMPLYEYNQAMMYLSIMSSVWILSSFYSLKGAAFISLGRTDINMKISVILLSLSIPLSTALVGYIGVLGAILSRFLIVVINVGLVRYYFKSISKR